MDIALGSLSNIRQRTVCLPAVLVHSCRAARERFHDVSTITIEAGLPSYTIGLQRESNRRAIPLCIIGVRMHAASDIAINGTNIAVSQNIDDGLNSCNRAVHICILAASATVICAQVKAANVEAKVHITLPQSGHSKRP